jgi:hypothetical protein
LRFLVVLLSVAQLSCAHGKQVSRADSFEHWTRYYETRMDLPAAQVKFGPPPDARCEQVVWEHWLGREGMEATLVVWYDPKATLCRAPWDLALHAACHRRMQHHYFRTEVVETMGIDIEAEADACEAVYRRMR